MRKVLESRALGDEERMGKLEEELKVARTQAEDADKKYDEVSKRLQQVEGDLERAEERAEVGEIKIVELEQEQSFLKDLCRNYRQRLTDWRMSWLLSRRSLKLSLRNWSRHSQRCPDTKNMSGY